MYTHKLLTPTERTLPFGPSSCMISFKALQVEIRFSGPDSGECMRKRSM